MTITLTPIPPITITPASFTTAEDIIKTALGEIGVISVGDPLFPEQADDCFNRLNAMIDTMGADGLFCYALTEEVFPLTVGKKRFTIGPNGDFNTYRPEEIDKSTFVRLSTGLDLPIELITRDQYNAIPLKDIATTFPTKLFYDSQYPLAAIVFDYAANDGTTMLHLVSEKPFSEFTGLTDTISFPPGYREFFFYNLAIRLSGPYRRPLSNITATMAAMTANKIISKNASRNPIRGIVATPAGMQNTLGRYRNIYTG